MGEDSTEMCEVASATSSRDGRCPQRVIATRDLKQVVRPVRNASKSRRVAPREYSAFDFRGVNEAGVVQLTC